MEIISLCLDRDCPKCGYPEMYAEVDSANVTDGALANGCRKCGYRTERG